MNNYAPGFYWIDDGAHDLPQVAEFTDSGSWYVCGREVPLKQENVMVLSGPIRCPVTP